MDNSDWIVLVTCSVGVGFLIGFMSVGIGALIGYTMAKNRIRDKP